MIYKVLLRYWN